MLDFPTSPTIGQTYILGNRTWVFNGQGWERQINAGQVATSFTLLSPIVQMTVEALPTMATTFVLLNHI